MPQPTLTVVTTSSPQPRPTAASAPPVETDPVPADVRAVIDLFTQYLAKVTFPDLDTASLRRQADELRAEEKNVQRARDALANAIATSDARLATLTAAAQRAVAYAQIYADGHVDRQPIAEALSDLARVDAMSSPTSPPKRRGRPPKQRGAELFDATDDASSPSRANASTEEVTP